MTARTVRKRTLWTAAVVALVIAVAAGITVWVLDDRNDSPKSMSADAEQKKARAALLDAADFPATVVSEPQISYTSHSQATTALQAYVQQVPSSNPTCAARLEDLLEATAQATSSASASTDVDLLGGMGSYTLSVTLNAVPLTTSQLPYSDTCSDQLVKSRDSTSQIRLKTTPLAAPGWMVKNQIVCDCYQQVSSFEPLQAGATTGYKLYGAITVGASKISVETSTNSVTNPVTGRVIQQFESVLERFYLKATAPASSLR